MNTLNESKKKTLANCWCKNLLIFINSVENRIFIQMKKKNNFTSSCTSGMLWSEGILQPGISTISTYLLYKELNPSLTPLSTYLLYKELNPSSTPFSTYLIFQELNPSSPPFSTYLIYKELNPRSTPLLYIFCTRSITLALPPFSTSSVQGA